MRQDPLISFEKKYAYVEEILDMMEMTHLGDALTGDLESGRAGRQAKIMFLDAPTSGLDAQSSYNIVKFLRKLTDNGMPRLYYFESNGGRPCSSEEDPAEYILQVIGAGTSRDTVEIDWPEIWQHSSLKQNVTAELNQISAKALNMSRNSREDGNAKEFSMSMSCQTLDVYQRMNVVW
ncbi:hypothetical protein HDU85_005444 [Gaertneriomyces sp. JEL0708]|nr:hypothetical protein HDU85_005444 [Gaertneriomyces sp. JEL0708]